MPGMLCWRRWWSKRMSFNNELQYSLELLLFLTASIPQVVAVPPVPSLKKHREPRQPSISDGSLCSLGSFWKTGITATFYNPRKVVVYWAARNTSSVMAWDAEHEITSFCIDFALVLENFDFYLLMLSKKTKIQTHNSKQFFYKTIEKYSGLYVFILRFNNLTRALMFTILLIILNYK